MIFTPLIILLLLLLARLWGDGMIAPHFTPATLTAIHHALVVLAMVAGAVLIDGLVRFFYWHRYWRRRRGRETPALIRDLFTFAIVSLGLSVALWWQEGLSFAGLITASGASAVVLGIALQAVIQDLFAGLSINLEGSYALGDWLTIYSDQMPEPAYGRVTGVTWRSTFLTLEDGRRMMVPNRLVTNNPVLNHSRPHEPKRHTVEVSVDIRIPCKRVTDMLLGEAMKVVRKPGMAATPEPHIHVDRISGDAIYYHVHFHAYPGAITPTIARSLMYGALLDVLQQNAVAMPVTQIEMVQPPDLKFAFGAGEILAALSNAELLCRTLNGEQLQALADQCRATNFPRGGVLMHQGEEGSSMFILLEGAARVTIQSVEIIEQEVAVLATGDIVGEMSLMTGAPRTATVTALTALRALEVTKAAISALLEESPDLLHGFSEVLAKRQAELHLLASRASAPPPSARDLLTRMRAFFSSALG